MWTFLVAQWVRLNVSNARDAGLIPGWETKIPYAVEQRSPCTTVGEPTCSRACALQQRPRKAKNGRMRDGLLLPFLQWRANGQRRVMRDEERIHELVSPAFQKVLAELVFSFKKFQERSCPIYKF